MDETKKPAGKCNACKGLLYHDGSRWRHIANDRPLGECPTNDRPSLENAVEDAIWQALDSEQGMPHSGVDPAFVVPEFLRLLAAAGYTVVMSVKGAERARLKAFGRDCVTHGDMTPGAARMLNRILDGETA